MPQDFFTGVNESRLFPTLSNILERRRQRELTNKLLTGDVTDLNNVGTYLGEGGDLGTLNTLLALRKMNMPTYSTEQVGNALFELKKDSMGQNLQQPRKLTEVIPPITPYQAQKEQREAAEFQSNQANKELDRRLKEKALQTNVVPVTNPDGSITYQVIQTPKVGGKLTVQDTEKNVPQKQGSMERTGDRDVVDMASTMLGKLSKIENEFPKGDYPVGGVLSGGRGTLGSIGEKTGLIGNKEASFRNDLQTIFNLYGQAVSGKVLTANEMARLEKQIPNVGMSSTVFKESMKNFRETLTSILNERKSHFQSTTPGPTSDEFDKMTNEQLLQYINKK